ncbi:MAG: hypothetical protein U0841_00525 [Chloroflexia bacterium]
MGQSLDEAVWSIPLAWAYDAVRETFDPATQARIERDLLRPAAEHLLTQLWRHHPQHRMLAPGRARHPRRGTRR